VVHCRGQADERLVYLLNWGFRPAAIKAELPWPGAMALAAKDFVSGRAATLSFAAWGTMMLTLPADLFPARDTGAVAGMAGTGAGLGGLAFTCVIGAVVDRVSYTPIFLAAGLLPLVALLVVQLFIPRVEMTRYQGNS